MLDLLIKNAIVVTMANDRAGIIKNGAVGIRGNAIACVGESDTLTKTQQAARTIDAQGKILMPGFVNAHTHSTTGLGKGILVGLQYYLEQGLAGYNEGITPASQIASSKMHIMEGIKRGYTTFNDTNFGSDVIVHVHEQFGSRARISELVRELSWDIMGQLDGVYTFDRAYAERYIEASKWLLDRYGTDPNERISAMVAFQGFDYCSDSLIVELRDLARKHGAMMHTHVAQSPFEVEQCMRRWGKTPVQKLDELGMLHKDTIGAHMTCQSDEDTERAAKSGMPLLTTPTSYSGKGGRSPIAKYLHAGGTVALGSDECAYTNVNPFTMMNIAMGHANFGVLQGPIQKVKVFDIFKMQTINAARAIGLGDQVGSLEVGKKADMIIFDKNSVSMAPFLLEPMVNFINNFVISANGSEVETVIIDGRVVVEDRRMTTVDEDEVMREIQYEGQLAAEKAFHYFSSLETSEVLNIQAEYEPKQIDAKF